MLAIALAVGSLYAAGIYLLLRNHLVKIVLGLSLLSNGVNLLILTAAGLVPGQPPLIDADATRLAETAADPLPQALVLTAIVITFALQAFALVLVHRVQQRFDTTDPSQLTLDDALAAFKEGWV